MTLQRRCLFIWIAVLQCARSLVIDARADANGPNTPTWVEEAIADDPEKAKPSATANFCVSLENLKKVPLAGQLCVFTTWKDVTMLTIKADPRRQFCEGLTWAYDDIYDQYCTLWNKVTVNCFGNDDIVLHPIGFVPTLCPQFPQDPKCRDFETLKGGYRIDPENRNQIVHIEVTPEMLGHTSSPTNSPVPPTTPATESPTTSLSESPTKTGATESPSSSPSKSPTESPTLTGATSSPTQSPSVTLDPTTEPPPDAEEIMDGIDWGASDMGYARVSNGDMFQSVGTPITDHSQCPNNMIGLSYFWKETEQTSCTIASRSSQSGGGAESQSLHANCRDGATETFLGCIYQSEDDCLNALKNPEYTEIVSPKRLTINVNVYAEMKLVVTQSTLDGDDDDEVTMDTPSEEEEQLAEMNEDTADPNDDALLDGAIRVDLVEFAVEFGDLAQNFRVCSDELFSLQDIIPGISAGTSMKFCIRFTDLKTYMPENGLLWVMFTPYFSATIRKPSSAGSLGFSGGIEYKSTDFVAFLNLTQPTDWTDQPDKTAFVREDLVWFKSGIINPKNKYGEPTDYTVWALVIFLLLMVAKGALLVKNCMVLALEERRWNKRQEAIEMELADQRLAQQQWGEDIMKEEEEWKKRRDEQFDTKETDSEKAKARRTSMSKYSDVAFSEGEISDLLEKPTPKRESN